MKQTTLLDLIEIKPYENPRLEVEKNEKPKFFMTILDSFDPNKEEKKRHLSKKQKEKNIKLLEDVIRQAETKGLSQDMIYLLIGTHDKTCFECTSESDCEIMDDLRLIVEMIDEYKSGLPIPDKEQFDNLIKNWLIRKVDQNKCFDRRIYLYKRLGYFNTFHHNEDMEIEDENSFDHDFYAEKLAKEYGIDIIWDKIRQCFIIHDD